MTPYSPSPFFDPGLSTANGKLSLIVLSRQSAIPALLRSPNPTNPTDEITNTRFGSFPHSTLLNRQWGTQVVASKVDARDKRKRKKRKRDGEESVADSPATLPVEDDVDVQESPAFEAAATGFAHILPPTSELWTASLPHRTQVVYTPDYSYILQRLRVRPGDTIIEAGAGSGSFTHAAARAVFNRGKVYSFEYHEPRYEELRQEIQDHGLQGVVHIAHRDVYEDGFLLPAGKSSQADAVFLDLPAPWYGSAPDSPENILTSIFRRALEHLTRGKPSPLNSSATVRLCTFSPCIEQVDQTVSALRRLGWLEIDMVEIQHKRIDVRRERIGLQEEGLRGVNAVPASVEEAVSRLRQLETSQAEFHRMQLQDPEDVKMRHKKKGNLEGTMRAKQARAEMNKKKIRKRKVWKEGMLCHRSEPELRTHTSYLVFAVLPQAWTDEDEELAAKQWAESS